MLDRARAALMSPAFDLDPFSPYAATMLRARPGSDPAPIFERWKRVFPGSAIGELRYRWPLTHKRVRPLPPYAAEPWIPWQEAERGSAGDIYDFEARLSVPAIVCDAGELLLSCADSSRDAVEMLLEAEPVMRREFASFVRAAHAWSDTFALWCLVRRPKMLALLQPFALAIATTYASSASRTGGVVLGTRFPFHEVPLASASAHLAAGLWALGQELELIAAISSWLAGAARAGGGWGDGNGAPDVLCTLAAADFLSSTDPSFDPSSALALLDRAQSTQGWWRVFGPEVPWITAEIAGWLASISQPFSRRFRWPYLPTANRDHKTSLPYFAWFDQLARLFSSMPGIASAPVELAFIDLAGFRSFNNRYGQDRGDAALGEFARFISGIAEASAIRDGGDEFLILGAPCRSDLASELDLMRRRWPAVFAAAFGADVAVVAPRILVTRTTGAELRTAREILGREIGALKNSAGNLGPEGILRVI